MRSSATSPPRARTSRAQAWQTAAWRGGARAAKPLRTWTSPRKPVGRSRNGIGVSRPSASTVTAWKPGCLAWRASANSRQPVSGHASSPPTPQTTNRARYPPTNNPAPRGAGGGRRGARGGEHGAGGRAEGAPLGGGEGGTPAGVDGPVALAVGVDD